MASISSFVRSVQNIPCKCNLSVLSFPSSATRKCLIPDLYALYQRFLNSSMAREATINASSDSNELRLSSLKVSVMNFAFALSCLNSSFRRTRHSFAFCLRHSIHFPHAIGTANTRLSVYFGMMPLFFRFFTYLLFFITLGYKHIPEILDLRVAHH